MTVFSGLNSFKIFCVSLNLYSLSSGLTEFCSVVIYFFPRRLPVSMIGTFVFTFPLYFSSQFFGKQKSRVGRGLETVDLGWERIVEGKRRSPRVGCILLFGSCARSLFFFLPLSSRVRKCIPHLFLPCSYSSPFYFSRFFLRLLFFGHSVKGILCDALPSYSLPHPPPTIGRSRVYPCRGYYAVYILYICIRYVVT